MDPDANLREIRRLIDRIAPMYEGESNKLNNSQIRQLFHDSERLAELVGALDMWIYNGGFLPADWRNRNVRRR